MLVIHVNSDSGFVKFCPLGQTFLQLGHSGNMELEFASQMIRAVSEQPALWHVKVKDVLWRICMTFAAKTSI